METTPGWYLREWLRFKGKKQVDLIKATGLSKGYVSQLVKGEERYNETILRDFAAVVGCTPGQLIDVNPEDPNGPGRIVDILNRMAAQDKNLAVEVLDRIIKGKS